MVTLSVRTDPFWEVLFCLSSQFGTVLKERFYFFHFKNFRIPVNQSEVTIVVSLCKLEWLSRDNLSSPPFAIVTYMYMTPFYKIRSEIQGKNAERH